MVVEHENKPVGLKKCEFPSSHRIIQQLVLVHAVCLSNTAILFIISIYLFVSTRN